MNAQTYWMSFLSAIVWAMMTHLYPNDSIHSLWLMCIERFVCCISHFREFHPFKGRIRGRPCITTSGKLRKTYAYSIQTPGTILNFRFLPLDTSIYYTCLHSVNILLVQFGPDWIDDLPPLQFWGWSLRLILTWNFIIFTLSWWRYRFVIALI